MRFAVRPVAVVPVARGPASVARARSATPAALALARGLRPAAFALALSACAASGATGPACPPGTSAATTAEAFFGRNANGAPRVTDADWEAFLAAEATPRFPDGLTVTDARGQWRGASGKAEREASKRLTLLLPGADVAATRARLEPLAAAYAARFGQESVLTTYTATCAAFVPPTSAAAGPALAGLPVSEGTRAVRSARGAPAAAGGATAPTRAAARPRSGLALPSPAQAATPAIAPPPAPRRRQAAARASSSPTASAG